MPLSLASLRLPRWARETTTLVRITLLVAPLLGVLLLRAPLVNGLTDNDTWFYSGYGWALAHHIEVFGWFYYADRFTVILPIALSTGLLGPVAGYLVLHYLILAGTGGLLYLCVRQFTTPLVGAASVVLMSLDPFFLRLVLWDYTTFIALPCTIAGAALWYLGSTPKQLCWSAAGAGILLSAAIFANPLSGLGVVALFGVEVIAAARQGRSGIARFATRAAIAFGAGLVVLVIGYLLYSAYLGFFPPGKLVEATLEFIKSNNQLAAPFQVPIKLWLKDEPRVYGPVLVTIGIVTVLGRSILANTLRARIAQFAVAYTSILWIYRFTVTSSVIETWWAYSMAAVTAAFGMPAILDALSRRESGRVRLSIGCALIATAIADFVIRSAHGPSIDLFNYLRTHKWVLLVVLVASCAAALAAAVPRRRAVRLVALTALCAVIAILSLTPANYLGTGQTGEFSPYGGSELQAYGAAYDMTRLIASKDRAPSRVLLWDNLYGLADITWANLPHQQGGIENVEAPTPLPQLTASEAELLHYPTTRRILVLSQNSAEVASALPALRAQHLDPRVEKHGAWIHGKLHYSLIELRHPG
jgi:hypothetical protein